MSAAEYLRDVTERFTDFKAGADLAISQVSDEDLFRVIDPESNSIGILMRHLAGSMRSRSRDFLTTDGEKPDRNREGEFEIPPDRSRGAALADWESAWACLFEELGKLTPADLDRIVTIRHEPLSVISAINRQFAHAAQHIGQIVMLAKHFKSSAWKSLSIPRGQSDAFNEQMKQKFSREF